MNLKDLGLMPQSVTRKIAYNTAVQVIGKVVILLLAAISFGILTRYLGPEGYGKFTLTLVYLSLFAIAADLGLFTIAVREMSKDESRMKEIVGNTLSLRALLSVVVLGIAIGIGFLLPYEPDVRVGIAIAAISQFFGLLNSSLVTVFQTKLRMEFSVIADIIGRLASLGAVIIVAMEGYGFYAVVATAGLGQLITFAATTFLARRYVSISFLGNTRLWKELLVESIPLGLALVVSQVYYRVDILILSFLRSTREVGIYGADFKVMELLLTVPGFFVNSVFPVLIKRLDEGGARAKLLMQKAVDILLMFFIGVACGGIVAAPKVLALIGGKEFVEGAYALQILLFSGIFSVVTLMMVTLYVAKGFQKKALQIGLVALAVNIALNLAVVPTYGYVGAAYMTLVSEILVVSMYAIGTKRLFGFSPSFRIVPKLLLAGSAMVGVMYLTRSNFPISFLLGGITYLGAVFALRIVPRDVIHELKP